MSESSAKCAQSRISRVSRCLVIAELHRRLGRLVCRRRWLLVCRRRWLLVGGLRGCLVGLTRSIVRGETTDNTTVGRSEMLGDDRRRCHAI